MAARVRSMCGYGAGAETVVADRLAAILGTRKSHVRLRQQLRQSPRKRSEPPMPEPVQTQSKPASTRGSASDERVLAQVEKWMAMIREIDRDRPAPPKLPA
jgi:hypothetical protein